MNKITNRFFSLSLTTSGSTQHQSPYAWPSSFLSHSLPIIPISLTTAHFWLISYIHKVLCPQSPSRVPTPPSTYALFQHGTRLFVTLPIPLSAWHTWYFPTWKRWEYIGLMSLVSQVVHHGGGHVLGSIPRTLICKEITWETVGEDMACGGRAPKKSRNDPFPIFFFSWCTSKMPRG